MRIGKNGRRTVWTTRHGERRDYVDPMWYKSAANPADTPLSANGRIQARDLGLRLRNEALAHIFTSPFRRAVETAHIAAEILDLPLKVENGASEFLCPEWFLRDPRLTAVEELAREFPRIDTSYSSAVNPVFPEDWETCTRRAARTIQALVANFEGNILVVGHGATKNTMAWGLLNDTPDIRGGFCTLVKLVETADNGWRMELNGDASYLSYIEPQSDTA